MNNGLPWTLLLVLHFLVVISHPVQNQYNTNTDVGPDQLHEEETSKSNVTDEKIISVRITSSVAVGRQKGRQYISSQDNHRNRTNNPSQVTSKDTRITTTTETYIHATDNQSELPPNLAGANIEFIKQLYAKKGSKDHHSENVHPFQAHIQTQNKHDYLMQDTTIIHPFEAKDPSEDMRFINPSNATINNTDTNINNFNKNKTSQIVTKNENMNLNISDEILVHSSTKFVLDFTSGNSENDDLYEDSYTSIVKDKNITNNNAEMQKYHNGNESYDTIAESSIRSFTLNNNNENIDDDDVIENVPLARSVSFPRGAQNYIDNIRHATNLERDSKSQLTTISFSVIHDTPKDLKQTNNKYVPLNQPFPEAPKPLKHPIVYSEPAKIYSEPAKFYSEPAKIYSEPAKIYSEPAKVYSEPAKIYSEPSKFYSEPASLHLPDEKKLPIPISASIINPSTDDTPSAITTPNQVTEFEQHKSHDQIYDHNHETQGTSTEKCQEDNCKVGYVVEGRQFKKYRVEERTSDGFIVGEYGVVRNEDGALRGVRYTADGDASPRLIYDALMKFLQLR